MGYAQSNLMPGEKIVATARIHEAVFIECVVSLMLCLVSCYYWYSTKDEYFLKWLTYVLMVFQVFFTVKAVIIYTTSEFVVTNKRVLAKRGLVAIHSLEILLAKVEGFTVNQSVFGRLLGYATIIVTGTGGSQTPYRFIASPFEFRQRVQEQITAGEDHLDVAKGLR